MRRSMAWNGSDADGTRLPALSFRAFRLCLSFQPFQAFRAFQPFQAFRLLKRRRANRARG
jgi:hypothetical protein